MKTLQDWLNEIETSHPKSIDLSLDRMLQVLQLLKLPKLANKIVTIGGTNGKGTTCAVLEKICLAYELKVGVYSSPHLLSYNERVRINNVSVKNKEFTKAFETIYQIKGDISLTYFEITTLAAFIIFAQKKLDIVILEVGLGGKFDATNTIDSDIQILTNVNFDHSEFLGSNLEEIGSEKAAIFRRFSNVIYGDAEPLKSVLNYANSLNCSLNVIKKDFYIENNIYKDIDREFAIPNNTNIPINNIALAIKAWFLLDCNKTNPNNSEIFIPYEQIAAIFEKNKEDFINKDEYLKDLLATSKMLLPERDTYLSPDINQICNNAAHEILLKYFDELSYEVQDLVQYLGNMINEYIEKGGIFFVVGFQLKEYCIKKKQVFFIEEEFNKILNKIRKYNVLSDNRIGESLIYKSLQHISLPGRMQKINLGNNKTLLLDVAHNQHSAEYLADKIKNIANPVAVFSVLEDKDIDNIIEPFKKIFKKWYIFEIPNDRKTKMADISRVLTNKKNSHQTFSCAQDAFEKAVKENQNIVGFGSFYVVEEILNILNKGK